MRTILKGIYSNTVLANILLVLIMFTGIAAALSMVREEKPNVTFDFVRVSVAYPGADPAEVEEAVSRKLEQAVQGLAGIKSLTTVAYENLGIANIEIKEGYDARAMLDRVRSRVNEISTFPNDAEAPVITQPLHSEAVMALYLNGDLTEPAMKAWAYRIKDELLQLPDISKIQISGTRDYEISVEISEVELQQFGLTMAQVSDAIRSSNLNRSAGTIRNESNEIRVRTIGRKYTGRELSSVIMLATPEGEMVTLDRLADIRDGFVEDRVDARINGKPAVILNIFKTSEEDAIRLADSVNDFVAEKQAGLAPGTSLGVVFDNSGSIRHQINLLVKNGVVGLLLVFFILWLFLDARLSLWAGIGILTSLFGGLAMTWIFGGTLNMISIGTIQGGFVGFEMMTQRDGFYITGSVEFPEGTSLSVTDDAVRKMESAFIRVADRLETKSGEPMIENLLTLSGQAPAREPGEDGKQGAHLGGVQIMLLDSLNRGIHTDNLIREWKKELGTIYGANNLSFNGAVMGPPEKPITIAIDGERIDDILAAADDLKSRLERFEGVFAVQVENIRGKDEIRFELKPEARTLGITVKDLADQAYAGYFGAEALRIQRGVDEVSIRVRYTQSQRKQLAGLEQIRIRPPRGAEVPLATVANLS